MKTLLKFEASKPDLTFEQKFTVYDKNGVSILNKSDLSGQDTRPNNNYCSVGADRVAGRSLAESHFKACLYAGVKINSFNCESSMSEWSYRIGPCEALEACDSLFISRYILHRLAEDFDLTVKFELNDTILIPAKLSESPKPSFINSYSSVLFSINEFSFLNSLA